MKLHSVNNPNEDQAMATKFSNVFDALSKLVNKIGFANGTAFVPENFTVPEGTSNEEAAAMFHRMKVAHELAIADRLRSMANKRYEGAKASAIDNGLLGDFDNLTPGKEHRTARLPNAVIDVKCLANGETIDPQVFAIELRLLGVSSEKIEKALLKATKTRRGARTVEVTLL